MIKGWWAALAVLAIAGAARSAPAAPGVDDLIARHIAARGGAAALKALGSVRLDGEILQQGIKLGFEQRARRPNLIREDVSIQGMTIVQATDGAQAWQIQPFQGRKDAENMSADESKDLIEDSDLDTALINYRAKGSRAELLGQDDIDGSPAWKVRITEKSGDQLTYYLDTDTLMVIRLEARRFIRGQEKVTVSDYGDYEKVGGVYFPFAIDSGPKGAPDDQRQQLVVTGAQANPTLDDAIFRFPAGAANAVKSTAAEAPKPARPPQ
ncbi:MAG: hypothetical protein JOZ27_03730 [Caulobacteraceae bacterium]|nr:hypothetical protein [Caulobacteraceae bacterium]